MYVGLDIGKQFNFSNSFGLSLDVGVAYILHHPRNIDPPLGVINSTPTVNLQVFYRF